MIQAHMDVAARYAELSSAVRLKVGAVIVKSDRIISIGYNGTPSGWDNVCEFEFEGALKTKPEVVHAEMNAIAKLARSTESGDQAAMFITHAPCAECAKLIIQTGIRDVYYKNTYRDTKGLDMLHLAGIAVQQVNDYNE